jgi:maltose/moltooligosaccharide transporter
MFSVYNGVAALIAFSFAPIAARIGRKLLHSINLVLGGLGLISIYFFTDPNLLLISMIGVGFAWASILAIPYAILTGSLPSKKFGIFMGIFNFFIVLPEITASSIYGFMLNQFFGNEAIYVLITGGLSLIVAALLVIRVKDNY